MALRVSDHAIVRWLERVYGVDMDALRTYILAAPRLPSTAGFNTVRVPVDDNVFVVRDDTLVTVSPPTKREKRFSKAGRATGAANAVLAFGG